MEGVGTFSSPVTLFGVLLLLNCVRWLLLRSRAGFASQQRTRLTLEIQALRRQAEVRAGSAGRPADPWPCPTPTSTPMSLVTHHACTIILLVACSLFPPCSHPMRQVSA